MRLRAWLTHARSTCITLFQCMQACAVVDCFAHEVVVVVVVVVEVEVVVVEWQESRALLALELRRQLRNCVQGVWCKACLMVMQQQQQQRARRMHKGTPVPHGIVSRLRKQLWHLPLGRRSPCVSAAHKC